MSGAMLTGLLVFIGMFVMILIGVPISISMLASSIVGFLAVGGKTMLVAQFVKAPFLVSASYTFAVIPLFLVVGTLAGETGIAEGTFTCAQRWLGRRRGGLLYATVAANAIFGACSGLSTAGNVVFSKIAMPELKKKGYDESLSMGCITAAGCLSALIPPSVPIITFCLLADLSVGRALVCGTSGGILFVLLMFACIKVTSLLKRNSVPEVTAADRAVTFRQKIQTLKLLLPILALFALIVGGSFLGWFAATVGGAIATVAVIVYALCKHMSLKRIFMGVWESAQMFGGLYLIIISGSIFSRFISITGLANGIMDVISASALPAYCVFVLVLVFYIFCGCIMDIMSIIIITVPIVFPLLTGLGFDEYVLCIMLVFVCDLAGLTPPVGMGVFTVASTLREDPKKVFKGVLPFFLTELAAVLLVGAFPDVLMWLPRLLGN